MVEHQLDLTGYEGYDVESIGHTDDDIMRDDYDALPFYFLKSLRSSDRVMTFEKSSHVLWMGMRITEGWSEGLISTLDPVAIGLVLAGQPLGPFEENVALEPPPAEPRPEDPSLEQAQGDGKITIIEKGAKKVDAAIVVQILDEIIEHSDPNLPKVGPYNAATRSLYLYFMNNSNHAIVGL